MSATKFIRATVISAPTAILGADPGGPRLRVVVWVPSIRVTGETNGLVLISTDELPESDWIGCPLPFDSFTPEFHLEPGDYLFSMAVKEAEICMMVQEVY